MEYIRRTIEPEIAHALGRGRSVFLFGARQTGKTTLVNRLAPQLMISLIHPDVRQRYEKSPALLRGEVEALKPLSAGNLPLVVLDEVQKVPAPDPGRLSDRRAHRAFNRQCHAQETHAVGQVPVL